jgi:hypothetical protein
MAVELRAKLTDARAAARRRLHGLRGSTTATEEPVAPDDSIATDVAEAVPTAPSESLPAMAWGMVKRARLLIFIVLAVSQALLALVSWRIRRRSGRGSNQEALEAFGEKLGGIAGTIDASSED